MGKRSAIQWVTLALVTIGLTVALSAFPVPQTVSESDRPDIAQIAIQMGVQPAMAQDFGLNNVWRQVYDLMPELPLENNYVNRETGNVNPDNTLVSRLIRYHFYVKGRPPNYRLDWKLTLADYLGANERILAAIYPGADTLQTNPLDGDIAAINQLNRAQREQLVQALVTIFAQASSPAVPGATDANGVPAAPTTPVPSPASSPLPSPVLIYPRPGDAQLLAP